VGVLREVAAHLILNNNNKNRASPNAQTSQKTCGLYSRAHHHHHHASREAKQVEEPSHIMMVAQLGREQLSKAVEALACLMEGAWRVIVSALRAAPAAAPSGRSSPPV
jgi:hypothetical protein